MISEERVEKSLVYLAESDEDYAYAHAKAKAIEKEEKMWAKTMASYTGKTENFWLDHGVHVDYYLDADTLLKYGVVDELF